MSNNQTNTDVILIGAGVRSATFGTILKEVAPDMDITVFEQLDKPVKESSNVWDDAGTGHSAGCELNYTTEKKGGSIDITKVIKIYEQFQVSKQFWSYLVKKGLIEDPDDFIMALPHISLVLGEKN